MEANKIIWPIVFLFLGVSMLSCGIFKKTVEKTTEEIRELNLNNAQLSVLKIDTTFNSRRNLKVTTIYFYKRTKENDSGDIMDRVKKIEVFESSENTEQKGFIEKYDSLSNQMKENVTSIEEIRKNTDIDNTIGKNLPWWSFVLFFIFLAGMIIYFYKQIKPF